MMSNLHKEESKDKADLNEFYLLLKSKLIGRVINGCINGCILEAELEELYKEFQRETI